MSQCSVHIAVPVVFHRVYTPFLSLSLSLKRLDIWNIGLLGSISLDESVPPYSKYLGQTLGRWDTPSQNFGTRPILVDSRSHIFFVIGGALIDIIIAIRFVPDGATHRGIIPTI